MTQTDQLNWGAIDGDPRFRALHRKKTRFLWSLMVFSMIYYFLLPLGAGYAPDLYKVKLWGPINVGLAFALSEFVVAWGIAWYYARTANKEFDEMSATLIKDADRIGGMKK
jgi:uncharacterized membrane protein (DUF485 family)